MRNYFFGLLTVVLCSTQVYSQGVQDMFRFSQPGYLGQARSVGLAGAMGAAGNDMTAISYNPAAASIFRSDEFGVSATFYNAQGDASLYSETNIQDANKFILNNLGYLKKIRENDPYSSTFAITYNQQVNYQERQVVTADNPTSSNIDSWIYSAGNTPPRELYNQGLYEEGAAYFSYLIDYDSVGGGYTSTALGLPRQRIEIERSGNKSDINITYSDVYNKKLHWGASLQIPTLRYRDYVTLTETGFSGDSISGFTKENYFATDGAGIGATFGIIYKPSHALRLGASIKTPEVLFLSGGWETIITTQFSNNPYPEATSVGNDDYTYTAFTAPTFSVSSGIVFTKYGFIDVDFSYIPYTWSSYSSLGPEVNNEIDNLMKDAINLKIGGEIKANRIYFRGGYNLLSTPYSFDGKVGQRRIIALGIGYRQPGYSIDLGYQNAEQSDRYFAYSGEFTDPVNTQLTQNNLVVSYNLRF